MKKSYLIFVPFLGNLVWLLAGSSVASDVIVLQGFLAFIVWPFFLLVYFPVVVPIFFALESKKTEYKQFCFEVFWKSIVITHIVLYGVYLLSRLQCIAGYVCNTSEPINLYALLFFQWLLNIFTTSIGSQVISVLIFNKILFGSPQNIEDKKVTPKKM